MTRKRIIPVEEYEVIYNKKLAGATLAILSKEYGVTPARISQLVTLVKNNNKDNNATAN